MNQNSISDYRLYHLHELENALENLDATSRPDEAKLIRELIDAGGYKYPAPLSIQPREMSTEGTKDNYVEVEIVTLTAVRQVAFASRPYIVALTCVLGILLALNIVGWFVSREAVALVPIAFQSCILCMVFVKHKYTRMLIKTWSSFLIVGGATGLLSMLFSGSFRPSALVWNVVLLGAGLAFLLLANRSVPLIPYGKPISLGVEGHDAI